MATFPEVGATRSWLLLAAAVTTPLLTDAVQEASCPLFSVPTAPSDVRAPNPGGTATFTQPIMVPVPMVVLVTVSLYWVEAPALVEVGAIDAVNLTSVTLNELLVALVRPVDDAVSVYVPPILIDRLANVAMPLESVDCVVVPLSVAVLPAGNAIVTDTLGTDRKSTRLNSSH